MSKEKPRLDFRRGVIGNGSVLLNGRYFLEVARLE
jgi:hypothetical protein